MPQASVIVPARDAGATLPRTLAALAAQESEDYEIVVVDDGSSDDTRAIAERAPGPVRVLAQPASGPAAARDLGVAHSTGSALAFCDADVFPSPRWLEAGVRALERADLVQGKVLPDPLARLGPFDRTISIKSQVGLWEAANLFVTRDLFDRVGGFRGGIRPRGGKELAEDVFFGYRALALGARSTFAPDALAHHAVFERDWRGYVGERLRLRYFPAIARQSPGLRERFLYRRVFLSSRTARFDLALAGGAAARALNCPPALLAAAPYLRTLWSAASRSRPVGPGPGLVAAVDLTADLVGFAALLAGSFGHSSLVL